MDTELFNRQGDPVTEEFIAKAQKLSRRADAAAAESFFRSATGIQGVQAMSSELDGIASRVYNLGL